MSIAFRSFKDCFVHFIVCLLFSFDIFVLYKSCISYFVHVRRLTVAFVFISWLIKSLFDFFPEYGILMKILVKIVLWFSISMLLNHQIDR